MQAITTIGLDIAKSVFQVHGIDAAGNVMVKRQLKRRYVLAFFQKLGPCLVGIDACASSHHWSRELQSLGHTVRLMPPAYVNPYVNRQKNDATDAEAAMLRTTANEQRARRLRAGVLPPAYGGGKRIRNGVAAGPEKSSEISGRHRPPALIRIGIGKRL